MLVMLSHPAIFNHTKACVVSMRAKRKKIIRESGGFSMSGPGSTATILACGLNWNISSQKLNVRQPASKTNGASGSESKSIVCSPTSLTRRMYHHQMIVAVGILSALDDFCWIRDVAES